jgi:hypothetical protein
VLLYVYHSPLSRHRCHTTRTPNTLQRVSYTPLQQLHPKPHTITVSVCRNGGQSEYTQLTPPTQHCHLAVVVVRMRNAKHTPPQINKSLYCGEGCLNRLRIPLSTVHSSNRITYAFNQELIVTTVEGGASIGSESPPHCPQLQSDYVRIQPAANSNHCGGGCLNRLRIPPPLSTAPIRLRTHSTSS